MLITASRSWLHPLIDGSRIVSILLRTIFLCAQCIRPIVASNLVLLLILSITVMRLCKLLLGRVLPLIIYPREVIRAHHFVCTCYRRSRASICCWVSNGRLAIQLLLLLLMHQIDLLRVDIIKLSLEFNITCLGQKVAEVRIGFNTLWRPSEFVVIGKMLGSCV